MLIGEKEREIIKRVKQYILDRQTETVVDIYFDHLWWEFGYDFENDSGLSKKDLARIMFHLAQGLYRNL
jgi:hypothetical protein